MLLTKDMNDSQFNVMSTKDSVSQASGIKPNLKIKKPMTLGTKIGIVFAVLIGVGAIVFAIIYVTVIRKKAGGDGPNKFGAVQVTDQTTKVAGPYHPGDTVLLKYQTTPAGFSGRAVWSMSVDAGKTFPIHIPNPGFSNSTTFVIPQNVFTDHARFKVADHDNTEDYVTTFDLKITPLFSMVSGPGVKEAGDSIFIGVPVKVKLDLDTAILDINSPTDWLVETSGSATNFNDAKVQQVASIDISTSILTWVAVEKQTDVYYRISTTSLKAHNYPAELSVVSPFTVNISELSPTCGKVGQETFEICQVEMVEKNTGKAGNFIPGTNVQLLFTFVGTFNGITLWTYTDGSGKDITITDNLQGPGMEGQTIIYEWIIPDTLYAPVFRLTASSATSQKTSPNYRIAPTFSFNAPVQGATVYSFPKGSYSQNVIISTVKMDPGVAGFDTKWSIGAAKAGVTPTFYPAWGVAIISNTELKVTWYLDQTQTETTSQAFTELIFYMQTESADGSLVITQNTGGTVKFEAKPWTVAYSPLLVSGSTYLQKKTEGVGYFPVLQNVTPAQALNWFPSILPDFSYHVCEWINSPNNIPCFSAKSAALLILSEYPPQSEIATPFSVDVIDPSTGQVVIASTGGDEKGGVICDPVGSPMLSCLIGGGATHFIWDAFKNL